MFLCMFSIMVFLGNPGRDYERTRHNFGWILASYWKLTQSANWIDKWNSRYAKINSGTGTHYILLPGTFMNLSGEPLKKLIDFFKLDVSDLLVVHDDIETSFGNIRLKYGGGSSGHNGLRSIDKQLGTNNYFRLRLGVGRPQHGDVASFVLSRFTQTEEITFPLILNAASTLLEHSLQADKKKTNILLETYKDFKCVQ